MKTPKYFAVRYTNIKEMNRSMDDMAIGGWEIVTIIAEGGGQYIIFYQIP